MREFIEQIVKEIVAGAATLDDEKRGMFLTWLGNHTTVVRCNNKKEFAECLTEKLAAWLITLSVAGILREYRLVIREIEWWEELEEEILAGLAVVST